jgi:hypothetical protein
MGGDVKLMLHIAPGYHIMSDKPSGSQYTPTSLSFGSAEGLDFAAVQYPEPTPLRLFDREIATFQGDIVLDAPVNTAPSAVPGTRTVKATVRYQACTKTSCFRPATRDIVLDVNVWLCPIGLPAPASALPTISRPAEGDASLPPRCPSKGALASPNVLWTCEFPPI